MLLAPRLGYVGEETTRRDGVDPHLRPVLEGEGLGDGIERGLGAGIRCDLRARPECAGARDIDDRAALARRHAAADQRHQAERALEVQRHDAVEELLGRLERGRRQRRGPGIVHQDVDLAEGGIGRIDQPIELLPVRHVAGMGPGLAAHRPDFRGGLLASLELAAGDEDVGTVGGKRLDHLIAQATAAAGH